MDAEATVGDLAGALYAVIGGDASMQDVNVIYVYNYYVPEFQFCEDADCREVISDTSNIQLNVGDTLPVYVQTVIPVGPSKGKLDTLAKELFFFLSSKHESLKFLTSTGTPMSHVIIDSATYYLGQLSNSRSSFLITSDRAISDVDFTLKSAVYAPTLGDTVFRAEEVFPGNLQIINAKYLYVLVPDDRNWLSDDMMISTDGGVTGTKMQIAPGMCGWYRMAWEEAPDEVLIYPTNHPELIVGQYGLWGDAAPLPLKTILEAYDSDRLYFIPDDSQWPEGREDTHGLFVTDPGVDGLCEFLLAGIIWDTDEDVNPLFFSNDDYSGYGACRGVRHGIVKSDLGPDNKPQFNAGNTNATVCAGNENLFRTLFNYARDTNEVQCYDMPFRHYGNDPRWGFDSDSIHRSLAGDEIATGGYTGGFYPVENSTDASVVTLNGVRLGPTPAARRAHRAEAPVPLLYTGDFDRYCSTPGWFGGVDCDRLSDDGANSFYDGLHPADFWDWGARQDWTGVTRNQQFCFESHAKFTYQEDQEFTFRGDDDIWVFINKKLAIDNGGAHLAAPGHVVLKNLNATYGAGFLVPGNDYPLDIFFCDRGATMSNVMIKTNILIKQTSGLSTTMTKNFDGTERYSICYDQSGDGSCASVALGSGDGRDAIHACGAEISNYGSLQYRITTGTGVDVATLVSGQSGWQYGGFDLSDQFNPRVNPDHIWGLAPGRYRLVVAFCNNYGMCDEKSRTYINFRIKSRLDVMTQTSTYVVNTGDSTSMYYRNGDKRSIVDKGLAGSRVPVYISSFYDGTVDLLNAVHQSYSLILSDGLVAYTSRYGDTQVTWPKTVNETGVETIWVTAPLEALTTRPTEFSVSLKSSAKINFYATAEEVPSSSSEEVPSSSSEEVAFSSDSYHEISSSSTLVPNSSSQGSQVVSSASTQSNSSEKQSSSGENAQGGECTLIDKGDGRIIQKCGDKETVLYKALCGTKPYDPEGDYFCYGINLHEKCGGEAYDVNTHKCIDGIVTGLSSSSEETVFSSSSSSVSTQSSSSDNKSQAIKTAPQISWFVQTRGRTIYIQEANVGNTYALIDMQGRVLISGIVSDRNFTIPVGLGGQYMLKIGDQSQVVRVW